MLAGGYPPLEEEPRHPEKNRDEPRISGKKSAQEAFLGKLKGIDGISTIETQTYTLEEAMRKIVKWMACLF